MGKLQCWVICYGTVIEGNAALYYQVCDEIESTLKLALEAKSHEFSFLEDTRDGEAYSVRFRIMADYDLHIDPPLVGEVKIDGQIYDIKLLELEECEKIYKKDLRKDFDELLKCLSENETPFWQLGGDLISTAIKCYEADLDDAAVIMCRTAIDSSLFLAVKWDIVSIGNSEPSYQPRNPPFFTKKSNTNWDALKDAAIQLGLFNNLELNQINSDVRKLGNFVAHIGERQMREYQTWNNTYGHKVKEILERTFMGEKTDPKEYPPGIKLHTSKPEASSSIVRTMHFMCDLAKRYIDLVTSK